MPTHWISKETFNLIAASANDGFNPSGNPHPDGSWDVELSETTMIIMRSQMMPDESVDAAIGRHFRSRACGLANGNDT